MGSDSRWIIVLPARRHSTRLREKLLLSETGQPLLAHTIAAALAARNGSEQDVWVACDDAALAEASRNAGANVVMVTEPCESGTERIWRALPQLPPANVILNLQADEPEMPVEWMLRCAAAAAERSDVAVATIAVPIVNGDPAVEDANVVKVVTDHESYAMYFSRAGIPVVREGGKTPIPRALRHVGLYAYRYDFLQRYGNLPPSCLEDAECLEQLKFLQAGARIRVIVVEDKHAGFRGIDTERDYQSFVARRRSSR